MKNVTIIKRVIKRLRKVGGCLYIAVPNKCVPINIKIKLNKKKIRR